MNILEKAKYLFTISKARKHFGKEEEEEENGKTTIAKRYGLQANAKNTRIDNT